METIIGFSGLVKTDRWNPVTVSVFNGGRSFDGELVVRVQRGTTLHADRTIEYRKPLSLPTQSKKRVFFSVLVASAGVPVTIRIEREGETMYSEDYSILGKVIHAPLLLALSRSASFDFLMSVRGDGDNIVVTYPHIETLPERWDAFDSVDIVAFHDAELGGMTKNQATAIAKWVDSGGTLFVSGGTHLTSQPTVLDSLFPVQVMGIARITSAESLGNLIGEEVPVNGDVPVSMSSLRRGAVLAEEDGIPLVAAARRRRGVVVFFAGNIDSVPFSGHRIREAIWRIVMERHNPREVILEPGRIFEDPVLPKLLDLQSDRGYYRLLLLGYLLIFLVAVLYFILRPVSGHRGHIKRWIAVLITSPLLSVAGYVLFSLNVLKPEYIMIDRTVISATPGNVYATARKEITLVSIVGKTYDVTVDMPDTIVLGRDQPFTRVVEGTEVTVQDIPVSTWNHKSYSFITSVEFALDGALTQEGDMWSLMMRNNSDLTLQDAVLIHHGTPRLVGTVSAGEAVDISFPVDTGPLDEATEDTGLFDIEDEVRRLILTEAVKDPANRSIMEDGSAILLAFLSDPILHAVTDREFVSRQEVSTLFAVFYPQEVLGR